MTNQQSCLKLVLPEIKSGQLYPPITCFMNGDRDLKRGSTPFRKPPKIMMLVAAATMLFWGAIATENQ